MATMANGWVSPEFSRGQYKEHLIEELLCVIILNLDEMTRSCVKKVLFKL